MQARLRALVPGGMALRHALRRVGRPFFGRCTLHRPAPPRHINQTALIHKSRCGPAGPCRALRYTACVRVFVAAPACAVHCKTRRIQYACRASQPQPSLLPRHISDIPVQPGSAALHCTDILLPRRVHGALRCQWLAAAPWLRADSLTPRPGLLILVMSGGRSTVDRDREDRVRLRLRGRAGRLLGAQRDVFADSAGRAGRGRWSIPQYAECCKGRSGMESHFRRFAGINSR